MNKKSAPSTILGAYRQGEHDAVNGKPRVPPKHKDTAVKKAYQNGYTFRATLMRQRHD